MGTITYLYDTDTPELIIMEDGKPRGGFIGSHALKQLFKALERGANVTFTSMDKDKIKRQKVQRLRAIWISQGIDGHRETILEGYGVTSTAALTHDQLDELIKLYSAEFHKPASEDTRNLRSSILTLLTRLGVYNTSDDWAAVNQYMMDKRIAGKLMYQHTDDELRILKRKLHSILHKQQNDAKDEVRFMRLN